MKNVINHPQPSALKAHNLGRAWVCPVASVPANRGLSCDHFDCLALVVYTYLLAKIRFKPSLVK